MARATRSMELLGSFAVICAGLAAGCSDDDTGAGGLGGGPLTAAAGNTTAAMNGTTGADATTTTQATNTAATADASATTNTTGMEPCVGKIGVAGDTDNTISFGGEDRTYRVHAPDGYDPTAPTMVVFMFHGYFENAGSAESRSGFSPLGDAENFIAVYPQGRSNSWNAGKCCGSSATLQVDDVGLVGAILDEIEDTYCVDASRVYASGFSNGGMLSHRLACELSDRFAAVAPVSGTLAIDTCLPTSPVAVMHTHGTSDPIVPYGGGGLSQTRSVDDTIAAWVTNDTCTADITPILDEDPTTCTEHATCDAGTAVRLCSVEGGGHDWPPAGSFALSEAIIQFFKDHPKN